MSAVRDVFIQMKSKVEANPAKVSSINGSYQFDITGADGGMFHAAFSGGAQDIGEGPVTNPSVIITMDSTDFLALVGGKLNPMAAFMSGKIKLKGDMAMAMKLQQILS